MLCIRVAAVLLVASVFLVQGAPLADNALTPEDIENHPNLVALLEVFLQRNKTESATQGRSIDNVKEHLKDPVFVTRFLEFIEYFQKMYTLMNQIGGTTLTQPSQPATTQPAADQKGLFDNPGFFTFITSLLQQVKPSQTTTAVEVTSQNQVPTNQTTIVTTSQDGATPGRIPSQSQDNLNVQITTSNAQEEISSQPQVPPTTSTVVHLISSDPVESTPVVINQPQQPPLIHNVNEQNPPQPTVTITHSGFGSGAEDLLNQLENSLSGVTADVPAVSSVPNGGITTVNEPSTGPDVGVSTGSKVDEEVIVQPNAGSVPLSQPQAPAIATGPLVDQWVPVNRNEPGSSVNQSQVPVVGTAQPLIAPSQQLDDLLNKPQAPSTTIVQVVPSVNLQPHPAGTVEKVVAENTISSNTVSFTPSQKLDALLNKPQVPALTNIQTVPSNVQQWTEINNISTSVVSVDQPSTTISKDEFRRQSANAHYRFSNVVDDGISGSFNQRSEIRDGDKVIGKYSYDDGFIWRTVFYEADRNGFRITKEEEGPSGKRGELSGKVIVQTYQDGNKLNYQITRDDIQQRNKKLVH